MLAPADTHLSHQQRWWQWVRCLDVWDGRDAMLARRWLYLPRVTDYPDRYAQGAIWYGAFRTTIEKIVGLMIGGGIEIEGSDEWKMRLEDVGRRIGVRHAAAWIATDLLVCGRTVNIVRAVGDRMIWERVEPLRLSDWEVDDEGEYESVTILETDYRQFAGYGQFVTPFGQPGSDAGVIGGYGFGLGGLRNIGDGEELVEKFMRDSDGVMQVVVSDMEERHDRAPGTPPLLDLADLAISHWRSSADSRWAIHNGASPQPVIIGDSRNAAGARKSGPGRVWDLRDKSSVMMLESAGVGFQAMETELARIAKEMATLGAQLVDEPTRHAETAEAVAMKAGGDRSLLHLVADAVEREIAGLVETEAMMRMETADLPVVRLGRAWHQVLEPDGSEDDPPPDDDQDGMMG